MENVRAMNNRIVVGLYGNSFAVYRPTAPAPIGQELVAKYDECVVWRVRDKEAFVSYYDTFCVDVKKICRDVAVPLPDNARDQMRYAVQNKILSDPDRLWMVPHATDIEHLPALDALLDLREATRSTDGADFLGMESTDLPECEREGSLEWRFANVFRINQDANCCMHVMESKTAFAGAHCGGGYNYAIVGTHDRTPTAVYDFCRMYPNLVIETNACVTDGRILPMVMKRCFELEKKQRSFKLVMNAIIGSLGEYSTRRNWLANRYLLSVITASGRALIKRTGALLFPRRVLAIKTDSVHVELEKDEDADGIAGYINNALERDEKLERMRVKLETFHPNGVVVHGKHKFVSVGDV